MARKKLQLSEIKVKSFVTLLDETEQRTTKGGYYHKKELPTISVGIAQSPSWTEYKTRAVDVPGGSKLDGTTSPISSL